MTNSETLLIFTKNPIPGTVKTRIGKEKGDDIAVAVYRQLLKYTRDVTQKFSGNKIVLFNEYLEEQGIWDQGYSKEMQVPGNLGIKMAHAFQEALSNSKKVVIIGSDCAELTPQDISDAFLSLDQSDIVIGPATDGGYYLLGMKEFHKCIFENMPWSQSKLYEATIAIAHDNQLSVSSLDTKSDIDYWTDWEKLGWDL